MDGHLRLSAQERKTCLTMYRAARLARRALVLLLLDQGRSYRETRAATLASPTMIRAVKKAWDDGRAARVLGTEERTVVVSGRPGQRRHHREWLTGIWRSWAILAKTATNTRNCFSRNAQKS